MNTKEMKALLKPMIKQCIREVLMEEGLVKVIAEAKTELVETKQPVQQKPTVKQQPAPITENRKKMLDEIGRSGYMNNSFDPFAGTKALTESQASNTSATGPLRDVDPSDAGVDISSLMNGSSKKIMNALVSGKAK